MVMLAAAPLATADTHHVAKGAQGPRASAETWEYVPVEFGIWYGNIVNNGLRSLVVDVFDNMSGVLVSESHQRIRFAAYNAMPTGTVDTAGVPMSPTHSYVITVTPNGPKGSSCDVEDMWIPAIPPVAQIDLISQDNLTVTVDGSRSYDPDGTTLTYAWSFGDLAVATEVRATHTYAVEGTYDIILVVTDVDGLDSAPAILQVTVVLPPLDAFFTWTASGLAVSVDAHQSTGSISSYAWSWGDTETGTGMIAEHTYAIPAPPKHSDLIPPYTLQGMTMDASWVPYSCTVKITNMRTMESTFVVSDPLDGFYIIDIQHALPSSFVVGDPIKVEAASMDGTMRGSSTMNVPGGGSMWLDVTLVDSAPVVVHFDMTITLTVTDAAGLTDTYAVLVTLSYFL